MLRETHELPHESWLRTYAQLPESIQVDQTEFDRLWSLHPAEFATVNVFGPKKTPRWQQSYGRDYTFSGVRHKARPIDDPYLKKILRWVNRHAEKQELLPDGATYNEILINWYQDGNHYIGKHSDDESEMVANTPIYSFSFGQQRTFRIRSRNNVTTQLENPYDIAMPNNSLVIMGGKMQTYYTHEVPKGKASETLGSRINITVRAFKE